MPRKISEPKLKSAVKLTAAEMNNIHFGRPVTPSPKQNETPDGNKP